MCDAGWSLRAVRYCTASRRMTRKSVVMAKSKAFWLVVSEWDGASLRLSLKSLGNMQSMSVQNGLARFHSSPNLSFHGLKVFGFHMLMSCA